jgi:hypothetical protein
MDKKEEKEEELTPCEWLMMKLEEIAYNISEGTNFTSYNILNVNALFELLDELLEKPAFVKPRVEYFTKPTISRVEKKRRGRGFYYEVANYYDFDYNGCRVVIKIVLVGDTPERVNKPEYAIVQVFSLKEQ